MLNEIIFNEGIHIANNLRFRTESSKVLANYKLSQSFTLLELSKTTTHMFTTTAKELVLAKYDAWFLFLIDMEHVLTMSVNRANFRKIINRMLFKCRGYLRDDEIKFLENVTKRETILEYDIKEVIKLLALYRFRIYNKVIENEPIFNKDYIEIWNYVHKFLFQSLLHKITSTELEPIKYYSEIGLFVSRLLHHTLYEVYEIDNIFVKDPYIILNYDDVINEIYHEMQINLLIKRLEKYLEEAQRLNYEPEIVKLKIYEEQSDQVLLDELEQYAKSKGLRLIKE